MSSPAEPDRPRQPPNPLELLTDKRAAFDTGLGPVAFVVTNAIFGLHTAAYVAVGLAGLPVFSGAVGGMGVLAGPSAGYLLAFPAAAAVAGGLGLLARRAAPRWRVPALFGAAVAATLLTVHPLGIAVLGWRLGLAPSEAVAAGAVFLPGDLIKNALAAVVAAAAIRAFPDLLRGR